MKLASAYTATPRGIAGGGQVCVRALMCEAFLVTGLYRRIQSYVRMFNDDDRSRTADLECSLF